MAKRKKMRAYAESTKRVNSKKLKMDRIKREQKENTGDKPKKKSKRERMMEFAKNVPKPKV